jgi:hypothetical protein
MKFSYSLFISIKHDIIKKLEEVIDSLILDPYFRYKIDEIKLIEKKSKAGNKSSPVIYIRILTNNRPLLLGQFVYFPTNGLRGFHNNWIEGYMMGYLEGKHELNTGYFLHVEVFPFTKHDENVYRYITLEEGIRNKLLPKSSPLVNKMKKYGLNQLLLAGSIISGPDLGSIETLEWILRNNRIETMLDLFCGTGALSKVALQHGVKTCTCVDLSTEAAYRNLADFRRRTYIIKQDAFSYRPRRKYDLVIADAFLDHGLAVVKKLAPFYGAKCKVFMMTLGFVEDIYWQSLLLTNLRKVFSNVRIINQNRLVQVVCKQRR